VDHDPGVGQRVTPALLARAEQHGTHARRLPDADGADRATNVLHRVIHREACRNDTAGRVDVQLNVLVRVLALEEQELRDDDVGDVVVDRTAQEHNPILQQATEDVPGALTAVRGLDHVWVNDCAQGGFLNPLEQLLRVPSTLRSS